MQPTWLIEDFDPDDCRAALVEEVKRQGLPYEVLKYVPFESGHYDSIPNDACVVFQGSLNLGRQLRREKKWVPGVWCDLPKFRCQAYYPYFAKYLLNDDFYFLPVSDLKRRKDDLYNKFAVDDCLFIRPDSGFKTFTGRAVPREEFDSDYDWMAEFSDPESLAVIASPKSIQEEWRLVVTKRRYDGIIGGSRYRQNGVISHQNIDATDVVQFVSECLRVDYEPDPVFVMDVCWSNGNLYLLELNSFSCSGLYACPLKQVVKTASELAIEEWNDANSNNTGRPDGVEGEVPVPPVQLSD